MVLRYLLYEINPGEGFNLRRDVYMRVASLVHKTRAENPNIDWTLVLPPWGPLNHWKSAINCDRPLPWDTFFDLPSLSKYVPVMNFNEFLQEIGPQIDALYVLQHYENGWKNGHWEERMDISKCLETPFYEKRSGKHYGWFWGYNEVYAVDFHCLSVQGSSSTLKPLLLNFNYKTLMVDRAEVILHDTFGDEYYWQIRRSMRFAKHLVQIGNDFRKKYLNSTDEADKTEQNNDWRVLNHNPVRHAVGGPYISVHLRRQDFVRARPHDVPTIESAAHQIASKVVELGISKVFVATDASVSEFKELKSRMPNVIRFTSEEAKSYKLEDGEIAIIDQWICAHARYFIGTHESTFSFRIQEEREILGFPVDSTFNRFCSNNETSCGSTRWTIVYPSHI